MLTEPKIVNPPAQEAAVVHFDIPRSEIEREMDAAIREVLAAISEQNQAPSGPLFAHHLTQSSSRFNCEVGFPVETRISPVGRVKPGMLPGATAVFTTYTGPYEGLFDAWREFGRLAQPLLAAQGFEHGPTLWERYVRGPEAETDDSRWQTELYQSIRR